MLDAVACVNGDTTGVEDDDVTVVDPREYDEDSSEFVLGEIDVDEELDWAERLVLENGLEHEQEDDNEEAWVIDACGAALSTKRRKTCPFTPKTASSRKAMTGQYTRRTSSSNTPEESPV